MATETATPEVETEKVFDLSTGTMIEREVQPKPEETKDKDLESEEEDTTIDDKKEDPAPKVDEFLSRLKEKYEIDSEDDLAAILKTNLKLTKDLEEAKAANGKSPWKSDKQEKIANFLEPYDMDKLDQGLETAAALIGMDIEKMDEVRALREAFILDNKDLTRDEAQELFQDEYEKKYKLNKDDFDDEKAFEKAQKLSDIRKKKEVSSAKTTLLAEKEKLKSVTKKDIQETEVEKVAPIESINNYISQVDKIFDPKEVGFDRFTFTDEKDDNIHVTVTLDDTKLKNIQKSTQEYLRNSDLYDSNKKIPNFDPAETVQMVTMALYGKELLEQVFEQTVILSKTLRAEQLAGIKPTKESKGQAKVGIPSFAEQFQEMGQKAQAERVKAKNR